MIGLIIEIDKMSMIITNFAIIITINQPKRDIIIIINFIKRKTSRS